MERVLAVSAIIAVVLLLLGRKKLFQRASNHRLISDQHS
jgi:hypothetical protein